MPKPRTKTRAASMKSAASMLKVPLAWITSAKDAGVDAFSANGTVTLAPVRRWIKKHQKELEAAANDLTLREQKLVEEIKKLRIRNERESGQLVPVSLIMETDAKACAKWNVERVRVEQEWPIRLAGKEIPECREVLRELTTRIGEILRDIRR